MKKRTYLYLIKENDTSNVFKIGISTNPFDRVKKINTSNSRGVSVIFTFLLGGEREASIAETYLHSILDKKRTNGEWFRLNRVEVFGVIVSVCSYMLDNVENIQAEVIGIDEKKKRLVSRTDNELISVAKEVILKEGRASASLLQRKLSIGYAKAARIIDELESENFVGPYNGSRPRAIL